MKAIVCTRYGPPEVLQLREVEKPIPKDNEVLIRIHAATVTKGDCELRSLKLPLLWKLLVRVGFGFRAPRKKILGQELAGEIEAVGNAVTLFKKGDQVFANTGLHLGAYAEYDCLPEKGLIATKPANMTYDEAAAVPVGGLHALQYLRKANIQSGQKVEDFTSSGATYDVIFDAVGKGSYSRSISSLKEKGFFLLGNPGLSQMIRAPWTSRRRSKKVVGRMEAYRTVDLILLKELIEAGKIRSVIDRRYPLEQTAEAHRYVDTGQKTGNVVITVAT